MLQSLRRFLLEPEIPLWQYALLAFPLALTVSALLFSAAYAFVIAIGVYSQSLMPPDRTVSLSELLGSVLFAPLVETLLLAGVLRLLTLCTQNPVRLAICSALIWGALHGFAGALWFFGTASSFFVYSCAYLAWRKISFAHAFVAAVLPHALINATVMALLAAAA